MANKVNVRVEARWSNFGRDNEKIGFNLIKIFKEKIGFNLIKIFKEKYEAAGIKRELERRAVYIKPSERRRRRSKRKLEVWNKPLPAQEQEHYDR